MKNNTRRSLIVNIAIILLSLPFIPIYLIYNIFLVLPVKKAIGLFKKVLATINPSAYLKRGVLSMINKEPIQYLGALLVTVVFVWVLVIVEIVTILEILNYFFYEATTFFLGKFGFFGKSGFRQFTVYLSGLLTLRKIMQLYAEAHLLKGLVVEIEATVDRKVVAAISELYDDSIEEIDEIEAETLENDLR
jgi:hypothetical protein